MPIRVALAEPSPGSKGVVLRRDGQVFVPEGLVKLRAENSASPEPLAGDWYREGGELPDGARTAGPEILFELKGSTDDRFLFVTANPNMAAAPLRVCSQDQ